MLRPMILGPVLSVALLALSACSGMPWDNSDKASAPVVTRSAPPAATAGATGAHDESLRLGSGKADDFESCRARCDRSYSVCLDSVAARSQSSSSRSDRASVFTPTDNCQHSLRQCFDRCGSVR